MVAHGGTRRALRRRRDDGLLQRSGAQAGPPERAIRMALGMRDEFAPLADRWPRFGYDLGLGIGIAIGYATLGRIGFEGRYDYGAVGNVVILASRLSEARPRRPDPPERAALRRGGGSVRGRGGGSAGPQGLQPPISCPTSCGRYSLLPGLRSDREESERFSGSSSSTAHSCAIPRLVISRSTRSSRRCWNTGRLPDEPEKCSDKSRWPAEGGFELREWADRPS